MRLAKRLAHAGVASRRAAEQMIRSGRVSVAGEVVLDPARDVHEHEPVNVDGAPVGVAQPRVVYALNKPLGVLSTAKDPQGRTTVVQLIGSDSLRLYPVGRLDADSTGLILLTNDGELAHQLTHPRFEVPKTYRAQVGGGPVSLKTLARLRDGVHLEDGLTAPAKVRLLGPGVIEVRIHEGRNRQVRRMCQAVGHPVKALERVAFGPLELGRLKSGSHRRLTVSEIGSCATPPARALGRRIELSALAESQANE